MSVSDKFRVENPKDWSNETLSDSLLELSRENIPNEYVRHRAVIQALTILNEQNNREFKKLDYRNLALTWLVILLTVIQVILGIVQIFFK